MRWLAEYYRARGHEVSGSDLTTGGHSAENVNNPDLVIYTSAIKEDNPELLQARRIGARVVTRAEALGDVANTFPCVVAVAGTHGKSTVTAMTASALSAHNVAMHLGGRVNGKIGSVNGEILVAEACEYRRSFLSLSPHIGVVLNVELDHTDCYKTESELKSAFAEFASKSKTLICPYGYDYLKPAPGGRKIEVGLLGDYSLIGYETSGYGSDLIIKTPYGLLNVHINAVGRHNAENAVYAVASALEAGADFAEVRKGLKNFGGVDRRLQKVGELKGVAVLSDYAHHPTEIKASLSALADVGIKKPLVVFQPHTHERLTSFFDDFISAFLGVDLIVLPVFNARGNVEGKTSEDLAQAISSVGCNATAVSSFVEGAKAVQKFTSNVDGIIVMGAGDNERILPLVLKR